MRSSRCLYVVAGALALLFSAGIASAGVDQWDFNGDLVATDGGGTLTEQTAGSFTFTTTTINGQAAQVASFPAGAYLHMVHGFAANGGGLYVNQYTLVMDVMFPNTTGAGGFASLYQTGTANTNDGDWFLKHNAGVGISSNYGGGVADGVWHRLALVVDLAAGTYTSYIDGVQAMSLTLAEEDDLTLDGRWSLDPEALIFADNDGENAAGFINSLQFRDEALSASAVAALGGPTGVPPIAVDFTQADEAPEGWPIYGPTVAVASGVLTLTGIGGGSETGTVLGEGGEGIWIDRIVRFQARVAFPGTPGDPFDHGGIFFCAQTPLGRYGTTACYVIDYIKRDNNFRLAKFVGGVETPLTTATSTTYEGLWAIELTDTEIIFTLDGAELIRYANADLRGGFMGFWTYQLAGNVMTVDDLAVTYAPGTCPGFVTSKVVLTAGKGNEIATVHIPTGCPLPYTFTIASAQPTVAIPVGGAAGALDVTVGVGEPHIKNIEIQPVGPGETTLGLSAEGADCTATLPVEVLGLFTFEEHFAQPDGPPAGWYIASQTATVISEELSLYRGPGGTDPFCWYAVGGTPVQVGKMESMSCRIKFARTTETGVGCHGGMVLAPNVTAGRAQGYMIDVIERPSDNGYRIYKDNNAGVQLGGPRAPFVWDADFHEWKVTFTPTGFTFSVDGVQKADVQDLTYRGGYLSFWCYTGSNQAPQGQNMFVDDISIEFGSSYCATITPASAHNWPMNPMTVFTVGAPYGSNFNEEYSLTVTSTHPEVAVPIGSTDGVLVLTYPQGTALAQTFEAECLSPGTTEFVVTTEGAVCPNSKATFTVPENSQYCEDFDQADGAPEGWTTYTGNWAVAGEALTVSCAAGEHAAVPADQAWIWAGSPPVSFGGSAFYEFSVNLTQVTADGVGRHGGIMLFGSAPTYRGLISGYDIDWIDRALDHGFRCLRYDNGVATTIFNASPAEAVPGSVWRIEVEGEIIRLLSDGAVAFEVTDATYREGYFAFWTYCNTTTAVFDNLAFGADCASPTASFTATPETGCAPLEVAFDAATSTDNVGVVSYEWDFGDTTKGSGALATHTYAAPGNFTVVLTVADAAGNTATAQKTITVNDCENPVASFTATPETGTAPLDVSFDASASTDNVGIVSYEWDFGDLATGNGVQTTHSYTAAGTYTAVLTVADAAGNVATAQKTITVAAAGGKQKPMDFNQDGLFDISDAVALLNFMYVNQTIVPPCGDHMLQHPANLALMNANGDMVGVDISDAVYALNFLFMGGPRPVMCADGSCPCMLIPDCPTGPICP